MKREDYEKQSYTSYNNAVIEYEADHVRHGESVLRVDGRTIQTISNTSRTHMITCYHVHYVNPRKHVPGSAQSNVTNIIEFLDTFDDRMASQTGHGTLDGIETLRAMRHLGHGLSKKQQRKCLIAKRVDAVRKKYGASN
jgi:hypothetical protein